VQSVLIWSEFDSLGLFFIFRYQLVVDLRLETDR